MAKWYRYGTLYREPAPGAIPRQGLERCEYGFDTAPSGRKVWGIAVYSRHLSDKEIKEYELEYMGEVK